MPTFFTFLLFYFTLLLPLSFTTPTTLHRRILHQPFFPQDSIPPSQPPIPSPPKYPFSTSTPITPNDTSTSIPFFPSYPSPPPPPSPASFASFPANISSLSVPNSSKSKSASSKLIALAIAAVLAAVVIVSLALFLHLRKRRSPPSTIAASSSSKTYRSDNNSTTASSFNHQTNTIPKLQRPSQTSSEFLYLGTLVNSHLTATTTNGIGHSSASSNSRKFDSPELRPLPPLNVQLQQQNYRTAADVASSKGDEEDEQFYSPKGSSIGTGSGSRRGFNFSATAATTAAAAVQIDKFDGSTSNSSSSYSSSVSGSGSASPENTLSPKNSIPKSPDLIEIHTMHLHREIRSPPQILLLKESASPSPPSSSSPDRYSMRSEELSPRISNASDQNPVSPMRNLSPVQEKPTVTLPPPPPPPPPPPSAKKPVFETPALTTSIAVETPKLISPIELLPSNDSNFVEKNEEDGDSPNKEKNLEQNESTTPKPKLKPLHWDKVRASSDREMVWDQLKCSSFKLNEEMIETLFVVNTAKPSPKDGTKWQVLPPGLDSGSRVLDPKKAQNIAILLRALNVTIEEVCEGLLEGNADTLGTELLESLLKMAPTKEEERKLREYKDDSPIKLGTAEKFLKAVLDIPYAFRRVDSMLYISNFESEVEYLKKSFETLEVACEELRTSRMFLKLLEAVLKTGNRMNVGTNRGDAHAFKLDTLLKLVDVKGADGKTTLLHFVVEEIIRSEGSRVANGNQNEKTDEANCRKVGLQVVSSLSSELSNVKKAAAMDAEVLSSEVAKLSKGIRNIEEVSKLNEATVVEENGCNKFSESMKSFMRKAEEEIIRIQAQESVALSLVKEITEYFHGNSAKEEAHPFRIFMVVRDFITNLDRVCKEVGMINERTIVSSAYKFPVPVNPMLQSNSGEFPKKGLHNSSEESSSP